MSDAVTRLNAALEGRYAIEREPRELHRHSFNGGKLGPQVT